MAGLAALAAILVGLGCALTVAAPDRRLAVLGVALALVAAPVVALHRPDLLSLAFRETAALTGTYLLWVVTRGRPGEPWPGPPTFAAAFVVLAFAGTLVLVPALGPERGPGPGLAAAAAAVIAWLALTFGTRAVLPAGLGSVLLLLAATLALTGLTGMGAPLDHAIIGAALLAVTTAAVFLAASEARSAGTLALPAASEAEPAGEAP